MFSKNIFSFRKPVRFHYTPRFYKGSEAENVYKFKSKYRKDEISPNFNDFRGNWQSERKAMRKRGNMIINTRLVIIIAVLILVFFYIIDFDLSIFTQK
jgi:hypothetical protein